VSNLLEKQAIRENGTRERQLFAFLASARLVFNSPLRSSQPRLRSNSPGSAIRPIYGRYCGRFTAFINNRRIIDGVTALICRLKRAKAELAALKPRQIKSKPRAGRARLETDGRYDLSLNHAKIPSSRSAHRAHARDRFLVRPRRLSVFRRRRAFLETSRPLIQRAGLPLLSMFARCLVHGSVAPTFRRGAALCGWRDRSLDRCRIAGQFERGRDEKRGGRKG